jgi:hypothetical protein
LEQRLRDGKWKGWCTTGQNPLNFYAQSGKLKEEREKVQHTFLTESVAV